MNNSILNRGKRIQDLIEESKTDPEKKEALDRAYQRVKEWIEEWKKARIEEELNEYLEYYEKYVEGKDK